MTLGGVSPPGNGMGRERGRGGGLDTLSIIKKF